MAIPFTSSAPRRTAPGHEQAATIDALPQPAAIVDAAGAILFANAGFDRLVPAGVYARNVHELVAEEHRSLLSALLTSAISGASSHQLSELRLAAGRSPEWVGALFSLLAVDNALPRVMLQFVDLSEQKRRESEIANREQRWSQALESASTGVWDQNFETGEHVYSDMWRTLRGLVPGDPIAPTTEEWLELIHPDDRDRVRHAIERQNAGDPDFTVFDYRERHKDGHYVWIECRGSCVEWGEHGRPTRIIGTDVDVTARKSAEEVAARTAQRLELALETSRIGIFEADLENNSVQWDERLIEIFGLEGPAREFPDGTWQSLIHPDDYDLAVRRNDTAIATDGELYNQYRIIRRNDGEIRHLRSRATILHDPNGRRRLLGVTWDMTEDVHLHQQLDNAKTLAESRNRELESAREHMEHMALHDHLTGLPNRRYLDAMLDEYARACARDGKGLAVFHVDLDRFKEINDTLGHHAGDIMLRHAAQVLLDNVREGDFVARIGGDEFVILAAYTGPCKKLSKVADRIIDQMRTPVMLDGHDCRFGSSIGIACNSGKVDARQLLLNADMALYHAKNKGRNRHEFFSTASHGHVINTKRLSDEILRALEKDEFTPFYQFQFDARTLDVAGVETLARWRHPERGILTPDAFLAVADDLDAVAKIDAVILDKALADFATWQEAGLSIPKLSVNVSSRRLHDPDLKKTLKTLKVPAGVLSFELLESIFLDDFDDQVKANLALLRRLGISIEIDDFGTGHASIVSLLRLNPRTLKIDRELIRRVPVSLEQRKLVGAIIDIGHSLNVKVVAEGVETDDHIRALRELGCDVLQGFGLSRPMPFSQTETFLKTQTWKRPERS